jgi:ActR/RegA family two-component response regulator
MATSGNPQLSADRIIDKKQTHKKVLAAVKQAGGNLSAAARELGITKRTLSRWLEDDRNLARAVKTAVKHARNGNGAK